LQAFIRLVFVNFWVVYWIVDTCPANIAKLIQSTMQNQQQAIQKNTPKRFPSGVFESSFKYS
jgi:hypothetical protein